MQRELKSIKYAKAPVLKRYRKPKRCARIPVNLQKMGANMGSRLQPGGCDWVEQGHEGVQG